MATTTTSGESSVAPDQGGRVNSDALLAPTDNGSSSSELFCLSLNPTAPLTIVFIHGLFSSHLEWAHVTPYLSADYHLLLVDCPRHSLSSHIHPATISSTADRIASLIRAQAHSGAAHVVGLSMGGFVALDLARRHPALVRSSFTTGAAPLDGWAAWLAARPRLAYYMFGLGLGLPRWWYDLIAVRQKWMMPHPELWASVCLENMVSCCLQ